MLRQWERELKIWYPLFKPAILHESGGSGGAGRGGAGSSSRRARERMIVDVAASSTGSRHSRSSSRHHTRLGMRPSSPRPPAART